MLTHVHTPPPAGDKLAACFHAAVDCLVCVAEFSVWTGCPSTITRASQCLAHVGADSTCRQLLASHSKRSVFVTMLEVASEPQCSGAISATASAMSLLLSDPATISAFNSPYLRAVVYRSYVAASRVQDQTAATGMLCVAAALMHERFECGHVMVPWLEWETLVESAPYGSVSARDDVAACGEMFLRYGDWAKCCHFLTLMGAATMPLHTAHLYSTPRVRNMIYAACPAVLLRSSYRTRATIVCRLLRNVSRPELTDGFWLHESARHMLSGICAGCINIRCPVELKCVASLVESVVADRRAQTFYSTTSFCASLRQLAKAVRSAGASDAADYLAQVHTSLVMAIGAASPDNPALLEAFVRSASRLAAGIQVGIGSKDAIRQLSSAALSLSTFLLSTKLLATVRDVIVKLGHAAANKGSASCVCRVAEAMMCFTRMQGRHLLFWTPESRDSVIAIAKVACLVNDRRTLYHISVILNSVVLNGPSVLSNVADVLATAQVEVVLVTMMHKAIVLGIPEVSHRLAAVVMKLFPSVVFHFTMEPFGYPASPAAG